MNHSMRAALVLAAWYLMVPPHLSQSGEHVMSLSRWTIAHRFFTEQNCDQERIRRFDSNPFLEGIYRSFPPEERYEPQCVASDDPRLRNSGVGAH
jgi:hypothetical protein